MAFIVNILVYKRHLSSMKICPLEIKSDDFVPFEKRWTSLESRISASISSMHEIDDALDIRLHRIPQKYRFECITCGGAFAYLWERAFVRIIYLIWIVKRTK